jgi:hypothetical protein
MLYTVRIRNVIGTDTISETDCHCGRADVNESLGVVVDPAEIGFMAVTLDVCVPLRTGTLKKRIEKK